MADMKKLLFAAYSNKFAIPAINFESYEILRGLVLGAKRSCSPLIAQTTEPALEVMGIKETVYLVHLFEREYNIPVVLHLDHARSLEIIEKCICAGYKSIMIDASELELEDNIRITNKVLKYAHKRGVIVEAEIGMIGENGINDSKTDLKDVYEYVKRVSADSLAISVGNSHGGREKSRKIDFDLLKRIHDSVELPLVLHGSSGIVNQDLAKVMEFGVCKINIETELRMLYRQKLVYFLEKNPEEIKVRNINNFLQKEIADFVMQKCDLFRCLGTKDI